jgi:putative glutathione S-transferase
MGALGWSFYPPIRGEDGEYLKTSGEVGEDDGLKEVIRDPLYDSKFVRELYFKVRVSPTALETDLRKLITVSPRQANPDYDARFTVPIVWDKKTETIVNNESSEIIRFMNTAFNEEIGKEFADLDLYPEEQAIRKEIDDQNDWVYNTVSLSWRSKLVASNPY